MLNKLHAIAERRTALLHRYKEAKDEPAPERLRAYEAAKGAVIEWNRITDPATLLPYIMGFVRDAVRYRHMRDESTAQQRADLSLLTGADLDLATDAMIEEAFAAFNQPELPFDMPSPTGDKP